MWANSATIAGLIVGIETVRHDERIDLRLDLAREFLEHEMLILHLGAEFRSLEQTLTVPRGDIILELGNRGRADGNDATSVASHSLRNERAARDRVGQNDVFGVLDEAVVLGVEDVVDRGQADILVDAAVAGDEVRVEEFVVVIRSSRCRELRGPISMSPSAMLAGWNGRMGDVGEEGAIGAEGMTVVGLIGRRIRARRRRHRRLCSGCRPADAGDDLREARWRRG